MASVKGSCVCSALAWPGVGAAVARWAEKKRPNFCVLPFFLAADPTTSPTLEKTRFVNLSTLRNIYTRKNTGTCLRPPAWARVWGRGPFNQRQEGRGQGERVQKNDKRLLLLFDQRKTMCHGLDRATTASPKKVMLKKKVQRKLEKKGDRRLNVGAAKQRLCERGQSVLPGNISSVSTFLFRPCVRRDKLGHKCRGVGGRGQLKNVGDRQLPVRGVVGARKRG